jgi:hypothetical protein
MTRACIGEVWVRRTELGVLGLDEDGVPDVAGGVVGGMLRRSKL